MSTTRNIVAYQEDHPLRHGMTLLEASAGTGKTYSVTLLFLRLLLEAELKPSEIVVVTFTRAAAAELRDRIHARIAEAEGIAAAIVDKDAEALAKLDASEVHKIQAILDRATVEDPLETLRQARAQLDTAAISTIHKFAGRLSEEFAMVTGTPSQATVVDSVEPLVEEELRNLVQQIGERYPLERALLVEKGAALEDTIARLAKSLVDDADLSLIPDFVLVEMNIAELLASPLRDAVLNRGPSDDDELHALAHKLHTRWNATGRAQLDRWLDDVRDAKRINGTKIRRDTTAKLLDQLGDALAHCAHEAPDALAVQALHNAISRIGRKSLSVSGRLAVPLLEKLTSAFFQREHKAQPHTYADAPSAEELPSILQDIDALAAAVLARPSSDLHELWTQRMASAVAKRVQRRTEEEGIRSHSHIIAEVVDTLNGPNKASLQRAVANRYRAALIDEFQDTDKNQWQIFKELFGGREAYTYLIGDPKQAIYGFRGANVAVYEDVRDGDDTDRVMTLGTNYRSDQDYNDAVNGLFQAKHRPAVDDYLSRAADFAQGYQPVASPTRDPAKRMQLDAVSGGPEEGPVALTPGSSDSAMVLRKGQQLSSIDAYTSWAAAHIARDILNHLGEGAGSRVYAKQKQRVEVDGKTRIVEKNAWREVRPQDCAVIVRQRSDAETVLAALRALGVPAVARESESVALSPAADGALHWLAAIESPTRIPRIRAFLVSPIVGLRVDEVDALPDEVITAWSQFFDGLRRRWWRDGLQATLRATLHRRAAGRIRRPDDAQDDTPGDDGTPLVRQAGSEGEATTLGAPDILSGLLQRPEGGRIAADLLHLAEVLNVAQRAARLSARGLRDWLVRRRQEEADGASEAFKRRVESDADAVEVVTAHSSKGLEYNLVWLMGLSERDSKPNFLVHPDDPTRRYAIDKEAFAAISALADRDAATDDDPVDEATHARARAFTQAQLRVAFPSLDDALLADAKRSADGAPRFSLLDARDASLDATLNEDLRLLYVALTRARMRSVVYLGATKNDAAKLLLDLPDEPASAPEGVGALTRTAPWKPAQLRMELWTPELGPTMLRQMPQEQPDELRARMRARTAPEVRSTRAQLQSYSSLSRLLPDHYQAQATSEEPWDEDLIAQALLAMRAPTDAPDESPTLYTLDDDTLSLFDLLEAPADDAEDTPELPLAAFSSGKDAGTALHSVFEEFDFVHAQEEPLSPEREAELTPLVHGVLVQNGLSVARDAVPLQNGLLAVLRTPIGGVLGRTRLADITRQNRIDELQFFLPMGDRETGTQMRRVFDALSARRGDPAIDPRWFDDIQTAEDLDLHGMLKGFIDLIFRCKVEGEDEPRYFIADYKSNRIVRGGEAIVGEAFTQEALKREMGQHHYYLQYHIYLVALHRWLRARLPDYDYERHVGGAYYFFVRGMSGADAPFEDGYARGVFFDRPSLAVIEALDAAFGPAESPDTHASEAPQ